MKEVESSSQLRCTNSKNIGWFVLSIGLVMLSAPLLFNSFNPKQAYAKVNAASQPTLQTLQQVTNNANGNPNDDNGPNSWGMHKTRIIRMSTGDLFTVYVSAGSG